MVSWGLRSASDWLFQQWHIIDAEQSTSPAGRQRAQFQGLVTVGVSALVLTGMSFVVLDPGNQRAIAQAVTELAGLLVPAWGRALSEHPDLVRPCVWSLGCSFFYVLMPAIVIKVVFGERLRDWGLSPRGYWRHLWLYVLLFLPVVGLVVAVSYTAAFQAKYPFYDSPRGLGDFLVWEAFYGLQFFSLEFFFRGFMLHGLKRRVGSYAIFFMVVPYCMIHFQKPLLECLGAIVAGTALGTLALRTGSIWGGVTIHVAVAWSMDWAAIAQRGGFGP